MIQKAKKNQKFGTSDLVTLIALAGLAITITWTIIQDALRDDRPERARLGAEALAHQMVTGGFSLIDSANADDPSTGGNRAVASDPKAASGNAPTLSLFEGTLGRDPWGKAYRYKLLRSSEGSPLRILVWSDGPNTKPDTQVDDFAVASSGVGGSFRFSGDDIGFEYQKP